MPFRNLETLESWLDEFRELGYPLAGALKVIDRPVETKTTSLREPRPKKSWPDCGRSCLASTEWE